MRAEESDNEQPGRRQFVVALLATAALFPATTAAQASKARRLGVLMTTNPVAAEHIVKAFADSMRELGYVEGRDITFEYRWADGKPERFEEMAADLVRRHVHAIVASSQAAALGAKRATTSIPIVMVNATDPVEAGLVASLAKPGGNVTGISQQLTPEIRAKQLQLLKEMLPRVSRVAVLRSATTTVGLREYEVAGQALDIRIQVVVVPRLDDLESALTAAARDRIDALVVPADPGLFTKRQRVADLARELRLPGIFSRREFTEAGGLMSYSARITDEFRRAAAFVDKIFRGATPASLPVEPPSQYELVINLKTAQALGVTIPKPLLIRADVVIQ